MHTYIALLRGINVGGNNKIDMKQLKVAFVEAGFSDAWTYINSGNALFSSDKDATAAQTDCEALIAERFGLNIPVANSTTAFKLAELVKSAKEKMMPRDNKCESYTI